MIFDFLHALNEYLPWYSWVLKDSNLRTFNLDSSLIYNWSLHKVTSHSTLEIGSQITITLLEDDSPELFIWNYFSGPIYLRIPITSTSIPGLYLGIFYNFIISSFA